MTTHECRKGYHWDEDKKKCVRDSSGMLLFFLIGGAAVAALFFLSQNGKKDGTVIFKSNNPTTKNFKVSIGNKLYQAEEGFLSINLAPGNYKYIMFNECSDFKEGFVEIKGGTTKTINHSFAVSKDFAVVLFESNVKNWNLNLGGQITQISTTSIPNYHVVITSPNSTLEYKATTGNQCYNDINCAPFCEREIGLCEEIYEVPLLFTSKGGECNAQFMFKKVDMFNIAGTLIGPQGPYEIEDEVHITKIIKNLGNIGSPKVKLWDVVKGKYLKTEQGNDVEGIGQQISFNNTGYGEAQINLKSLTPLVLRMHVFHFDNQSNKWNEKPDDISEEFIIQ